jgi:hypothetical protein
MEVSRTNDMLDAPSGAATTSRHSATTQRPVPAAHSRGISSSRHRSAKTAQRSQWKEWVVMSGVVVGISARSTRSSPARRAFELCPCRAPTTWRAISATDERDLKYPMMVPLVRRKA